MGGEFILAYLPPNKESLKDIIDYFKAEMEALNITVNYQEAKESDLLSRNYDHIVMATGAIPAVPPIKGLKTYYWSEFLFDDNIPENQHIFIIGGGLIGVEVASILLTKSNQVSIV